MMQATKQRWRPWLWIGGFWLMSMMAMSGDAEAGFAIRSRVISGVTYVYLNDVAAYYGARFGRSGKDVQLLSDSRRLDLKLDNRRALINGAVIDLAYAPREDKNVLFISERDLTLQIDPIFRTWSLPRDSVTRIVIDAGHGDKDNGAEGAKYKEKDLTLQIATKLKARLSALGFAVTMTRSGDSFLELNDRPAVARKVKADLFISIHVNAASSTSADGIETYFVTPVNMPSSHKTELVTSKVAGNAYDRLNTQLAYQVHRHLIALTGATDRGMKRYRWRVLQDPPCPALLCELGFVTNAAEEKQLGNAAYQDKLVDALTRGIVAYRTTVAPQR